MEQITRKKRGRQGHFPKRKKFLHLRQKKKYIYIYIYIYNSSVQDVLRGWWTDGTATEQLLVGRRTGGRRTETQTEERGKTATSPNATEAGLM